MCANLKINEFDHWVVVLAQVTVFIVIPSPGIGSVLSGRKSDLRGKVRPHNDIVDS